MSQFKEGWLKNLAKALFQLFGLTAGKAIGFDQNGKLTSLDGVGVTVSEDELALADNTTANASTAKHGFLKKLSNVATEFMNGEGNWAAVPADAAAAAHIVDSSAAHAASAIANTPAGNIAATDVQAAINELDTEKAAVSAIPVKASGAEVDTGTDDDKFITPKALADSRVERPYKVYAALLTQSGTDAPVATVLENTLGGTPAPGYAEVGEYTLTLAGAFPVAKTGIPSPPPLVYSDANGVGYGAFRTSDNVITIVSKDSGSQSNNVLSNAFIEIRVYP